MIHITPTIDLDGRDITERCPRHRLPWPEPKQRVDGGPRHAA